VGDAVAVVYAEDYDIAKKAANLVEVEYEVMKGIFSPEDALLSGAPVIQPSGNICHQLHHQIGDVTSAREESDIVLKGIFKTSAVDHAYLEPESGTAEIIDGILTVRYPSQAPFDVRMQVSEALNLPLDKIRVILTPLGGGFGGKTDATIESILALGALKLKKPVKITLDREESLRVSTKKHPFVMKYEVGLKKNGKIKFVKADLLADSGPYTAHTPRVIDQACIFSCGPYDVANVDVKGVAVHTNNANASAMRGFGINQVAVAIESLLDEAADKLNIDPFDLRLTNALEVGKKTITGQYLTASVGLIETIKQCKKASKDDLAYYKSLSDDTKRIGIGIACGYKNVGAGKGRKEDAGAVYTLMPDGKVKARISGVDMGQGFRTAMLQIASQTTNIYPEYIDLITGDTLLTHKHNAAAGERQLLINGKAAYIAAVEFKDNILRHAGKVLSCSPENLDIWINAIVRKNDNSKVLITLEQLAEKLPEGAIVESECEYTAPPTYPLSDVEIREKISQEEYRNYTSYAYGTHVAIVEVDAATETTRVLKVIAAHDVGKAINPQKIEGQIEGSILMGQGYALTENYRLEEGFMVTKNYRGCGIPTIMDMPQIEVITIEDPEPQGPFGAKGVSEMATVPTTPAVLNAIYNATGKRIYAIPYQN